MRQLISKISGASIGFTTSASGCFATSSWSWDHVLAPIIVAVVSYAIIHASWWLISTVYSRVTTKRKSK